ncbi:competence type IV pilus minor pilin ComGF [Listeria grayi]|uniref:Prepilin-type cleavage/methylation N-terminal domain protein n=2 Tax=Listeria grayi TaxID=1641 RepID=D7V029_LISGR|nr:competence type IV pilus minor pilin ComGF [Listeria grayi]EFI83782.1 prepilin-type cleavage/methylation N-terminal domain protein [Listeria grayi DSM 20601]STY43120.1 Competence protein ComGF [Listeria grayi]
MQQHPLRKSVQNKKANGFTFLEALLALLITALLLSFYPLIHHLFERVVQQSELDLTAQWELFLQQSQKDMQFYKKIEVKENQLFITQPDNKIIQYNLHKTTFRKQSEGKGHEPLLLDVQAIYFQHIDNYLLLKITMTNGKERLTRYHTPLRKEGS